MATLLLDGIEAKGHIGVKPEKTILFENSGISFQIFEDILLELTLSRKTDRGRQIISIPTIIGNGEYKTVYKHRITYECWEKGHLVRKFAQKEYSSPEGLESSPKKALDRIILSAVIALKFPPDAFKLKTPPSGYDIVDWDGSTEIHLVEMEVKFEEHIFLDLSKREHRDSSDRIAKLMEILKKIEDREEPLTLPQCTSSILS